MPDAAAGAGNGFSFALTNSHYCRNTRHGIRVARRRSIVDSGIMNNFVSKQLILRLVQDANHTMLGKPSFNYSPSTSPNTKQVSGQNTKQRDAKVGAGKA